MTTRKCEEGRPIGTALDDTDIHIVSRAGEIRSVAGGVL